MISLRPTVSLLSHSADAYINVLTKANVRRKFCVHELFGFDVILDEQCKPYIVEVNISPR